MIAFLILILLVLIHEWGHYIVAKWVGVHVEEFGFGYPPRAAKLFTRKGTVFTLNWLPFGGFVRLAGDDAETFERLNEKNQESQQTSKLFYTKSKLRRLCIIYAGAAMNLLLGALIFAGIYTVMGIPTSLPHPRIDQIVEHSPAQIAGIQPGDEILQVEGKLIKNSQEFITAIQEKRGSTLGLVWIRGGKEYQGSVYVRTLEETPEKEGALGVVLIDTELRQYPRWQMPFLGIKQGVQDSIMFSRMILTVLGDMVAGLFTRGKIAGDVSGVIGIVYTTQKEHVFDRGWLAIANFTALISLNLGIINILPIPALDGGRAVFVLLEGLIGKRRRMIAENYANTVGMVILVGLLVVISVKDVWMILGK